VELPRFKNSFIHPESEAVMLRQLAHLNFVTNDLPKIIDFYVNKLGMQVKFTLDTPEGVHFGYYFGCGNSTFLEFFDQALASQVWGGNVEALTAGTRYKHFCLEVTGLEAYREQLLNKGVAVTEIATGMDNSRQAWITDPDGNAIELMEYGPKSLQLAGQP
jgi:catechol 2,3-dioxygenase-like lactoylglutathione lyase family enzyme